MCIHLNTFFVFNLSPNHYKYYDLLILYNLRENLGLFDELKQSKQTNVTKSKVHYHAVTDEQ